jgi:HPr kinase/phosphorylase
VVTSGHAEGAPAGWAGAGAALHRAARIGIVRVPSLFGETAVADRARIELVVRLEAWGAGEVERIGLERRSEDVAGFAVEVLTLPVAPGRNIASLVEVGARNHVLRSRGKSGAEELDARVFALLRGEGG